MLKLREAKVVWTRGTDNRLVLEEHGGCARDVVAEKRVEVSWLRGVKSVVSAQYEEELYRFEEAS